MDARPYHNKADGLVGGFPCQAFSVAGLGLGFADIRGTIFYDFIRILKETEPKFFVFENVKGLVGHDKEKDIYKTNVFETLFGKVEKTILVKKARKYCSNKQKKKEIGRTLHTMENVLDQTGYFWSWQVLNTKDFGVPQNRERVFMVGFKSEEDFNNFSFPDAFPLEKRLKDVLEDDVDEKYYLSDKLLQGFKQHKQRHKENGNGFGFEPLTVDSEISKTVLNSSKYYQTDNYIKIAGNINGKGHEYINRVYGTDGVAPALPTMQGGGARTEDTSKGFP